MSHLARFHRLRNAVDIDRAISSLDAAANSEVGHASTRLSAARRWAKAMYHYRSAHDSIPAYQRVLQLIPQVVWLGNQVARRLENVHHQRCDALVMRQRSEEVICVPLPRLSPGTLNRWRSTLSNSMENVRDAERASRTANLGDNFETMLASLWFDVVKPTLAALDIPLVS
jgi:hypothetical protein